MNPNLGKAIDIIVQKIDPDKILLFGSRANGKFNHESDYDLCILKKNIEHRRKTAQDIYKLLLGLNLPVDIIVETPEKFDQMRQNQFLIYNEIAQNSEVLYERH